ncbi:AAA family ATPase [Marinobacter orientalis]|uniref:AAA family ATPase n=1 Tax=Marinobacter orientalis TaxID=1928859 RepID=A0A7Y0RCK2_9GAMM|nr:AAA family ATPase [Marinobacter orientalis]NMT63754.1 AAA family ATPase [Marinobacter orientalis]TGX49866.1 peptidoglycan-binding protein [Marinobacter orientalis]
MYYDFFGFREPPFSIAPDPRYLYLSERHKEALAHLMYGVQGQGGFIVITGEVGTGKTTVSRCFIENVPDHVDIALILNPRLSARELLSSICDELEIPHPVGASIKELVGLINDDLLKAHAAGRHKVLMIDEAQNLSAEVLEQLRLLTNLETAEKKLLQIVLLGQPELQEILELPQLRQLNQRVTARYHLDALGREEIEAYLRYRLSVAGLRGEIFTDGAVRALYRSSKGIPRLINLISDRALLGAYAEGEHQISASHIRTAAREVNGNRRGKQSGGRSGKSYLVPVAASVVVAVVMTAWALDRLPASGRITTGVSAEPDGVALSGTIERVEPSFEPTPELLPEPVTIIEGSLPDFEFPDDTLSLRAAFGELFAVWGRDYRASNHPIACDYAEEQGLGCLDNRGSRRSLEHLNRPAILQLRNGAGDSRYTVLSGLEGDRATIERPEGQRDLSFSSLEPYWFGEFTVLWEVPPHIRQNSEEDSDSSVSAQIWMGSRMMELASRYSGSREEENRINRMTTGDQIRWYQKRKGLKVDGIAGAMTIIQMNNDLESDGPRLRSAGSG